uniref:Uncharacterized protein n=1 Tax=Monopterus albus TaxID=43700 RepID=A0A3Q3JBV8_MONAL
MTAVIQIGKMRAGHGAKFPKYFCPYKFYLQVKITSYEGCRITLATSILPESALQTTEVQDIRTAAGFTLHYAVCTRDVQLVNVIRTLLKRILSNPCDLRTYKNHNKNVQTKFWLAQQFGSHKRKDRKLKMPVKCRTFNHLYKILCLLQMAI